MAHSSLHFSVGWVVGSLCSLPLSRRMLRKGRRLSAAFRVWFVVSYAVGIYAAFPGILRRLGVQDAVCDGWWMNVFLLYPFLNEVKPGAVTMGPIVMGACLGLQYAALVAAVWYVKRSRQHGGGGGNTDLHGRTRTGRGLRGGGGR